MGVQLEKAGRLLGISLFLFLVYGVFRLYFQPDALEVKELKSDEVEIAWLHGASGSSDWENLVRSECLFGLHSNPWVRKLSFVTDSGTFPQQSASIPSFQIVHPESTTRVVLRWYKITSETGHDYWIKKLLGRKRGPSIILGGSTSSDAMALAGTLAEQTAGMADIQKPVLIFTTASANMLPYNPRGLLIPATPEQISLMNIYPGRTFRFGFDNRTMCDDLIQVLWGRRELRPHQNGMQMVVWEDDAYARDFVGEFWQSMARRFAFGKAQPWFLFHDHYLARVVPFLLSVSGNGAGSDLSENFGVQNLPTTQIIDSSVGTRNQPNRFESSILRFLIADFEKGPSGGQRLLVLGGQAGPSRRVLREFNTLRPDLAHGMVVVAGDSLSMDMFYRDRGVNWPVSELPYRVLFFNHADPVSMEAGFLPLTDTQAESQPFRSGSTDELVLDSQILQSLAMALLHPDQVNNGTVEVLRSLRWNENSLSFEKGSPFFDIHGNRRSGTGECVGLLTPPLDGKIGQIDLWTMRYQQNVPEPVMVPLKSLPLMAGGGR